MLKVFFSVNHSGCSWWRCRQPAAMIKKLGLADVIIYSLEDTDRSDIEKILPWADVVVCQSPAGVSSVAVTVAYQERGKVVIADYDDLVYSCSPFNPGYKTLGVKEVKVKTKDGNENWLWKDGEKGFSIKDNYCRYRAQLDLLGLIDGLTVTNDYLMERYLDNMPEVSSNKSFVLPNSIDFDLFKPFPKKDTGQIRIGWTASSSHLTEAWMVRNIFTRIFDKYKDSVKLILLGDIIELVQYFKSKVEFHQFVDLSIYPLKLAALNLDIGICPLVNDEFNSFKSQLKWSEFASLKVPCVVSDTLPYGCIEDGVTGCKAKDEDAFFEKLCLLIDNEKLRRDMGNNAFEQNYRDFNLKTNVKLWVEAYESCHSRVWKHRETPLPEPAKP